MLNQKEEKIVRLIEMSGPTLPSIAAKAVDTEIYLASAILSGLVQHNHLKISHLKVGSSPLYYKPGQESRVRERLFKELNELEKKALDRMKQIGVAFPNDLYPQERVLLKDLSDFVEHLTLKINEQEVDVWRYHSINDEQLNKIIDEKINGKEEEPVEEIIPETPKIEEEEHEIKEEIKEKIEIPQPEKKPKRKPKAKEISEFESKIDEYLNGKGIKIDNVKRVKKGESLYKAILSNPLGNQEILILVKDKAKINENDISKFYTLCTHHKKTGIMFIPQKLSKTTESFLAKHIGEIVKIIVIKK